MWLKLLLQNFQLKLACPSFFSLGFLSLSRLGKNKLNLPVLLIFHDQEAKRGEGLALHSEFQKKFHGPKVKSQENLNETKKLFVRLTEISGSEVRIPCTLKLSSQCV